MMLDWDLVAFFLDGTTPSKNQYRTTRLQFACWTPDLAVREQIGFITNHLISHSIVIVNHLTFTFFMMKMMIMIVVAIVRMMIIVNTLILLE